MKTTVHKFIWLIVTTFCFPTLVSLAQTTPKKQQAYDLAMKAIKVLEKEKKYEKAIDLLKQARKLDPKNTAYSYELAYAYYAKKAYKKAIKTLQPIIKKQVASEQFYLLLGTTYELAGSVKKATNTYEEGIKKFPTAGQLYLELGGLAYKMGNNDLAVSHWESGIEHAPTFSSNYYWAAKLYCHSSEKIWGLLYGELFMNLEPNSARSQEVSQLLYATFVGNLSANRTQNVQTNFSQRARMFILLADDWETKLPFQVVFELNMNKATPTLTSKDTLQLLNEWRYNFLTSWDKQNSYQNILFEHQEQLKVAGHFEAYTYWLLQQGNKESFKKWLVNNQPKFKKFVDWINKHPLRLSNQTKFHRLQYVK